MKHALLILLVVLFPIMGCEKADDKPKPSIPATPVKATAEAPAPTIAESEVEVVFDAWLNAQNSGDFDAYMALYGPKFKGTKRVGPKTTSFNREGWKADRGRMFQKEMKVSSGDIDIAVSAGSAVIRFQQTWESGRYKDTGPKQLILTKSEDGKLLITGEEMLKSTVLSASKSTGGFDPNELALVHGGQYIILTDKVEDSWMKGNVQTDELADAARGVEFPNLPVEFRQWKGQNVMVFDAAGEAVCKQKVMGLRVIARVTPHFATMQEWYKDGKPRKNEKEIAQEAFDLAGWSVVLVGKLDAKCKDGVYARTLAFQPQKVGIKTLPKKAADAFNELPGVQRIQKEYEASGHDGLWWEGEERLSAKTFEHAGKTYAAISAAAGPGCGEFYGEFWAILDMTEGAKLLTDGEDPGPLFAPLTVVDADTDGQPEFVSAHQIARNVNGTWRVVTDLTPPNLDCGC